MGTDKIDTQAGMAPGRAPDADGPVLLDRYGEHLAGMAVTDDQKQAFLLALFQIMQAFVDLGFSVKPGDKIAPGVSFGMDDVLEYLVPDDTAHETFAPRKPSIKESEGK